MPFARCSSLDRQLACAGGELLGGVDEKSEAARVAADWGTMVHHWKETGEITSPRANLPPLFEKKLRITGVKRSDWWPEDIQHEAAIAIAPFKEYRINREGDRGAKEAWKAAHSDEFVTGTVDGDWFMFDRLHVNDLKTGREVTFEQYECQVVAYCLGIARVLDYRGPVHASVTWWPRYPVPSLPQMFGRVVEQDELLAFEKKLVTLRDTLRRGKEKLVLEAGEHCTWCPSRSICTEYQASEWTWHS